MTRPTTWPTTTNRDAEVEQRRCRSAAAATRTAARTGSSSRTGRSGSARSCRRRGRRASGRAARPTAARRPSAHLPARPGPTAAAAAGRTARARPSSRGGPGRGHRHAPRRGRPGEAPGRVAHTASSTAAYGVPASTSASRSSSRLGAVLLQQREPVRRVGHRGVLEHQRQVVGQLAVGVDQEAARPVALLEPAEHLAAPAGVAVGPVRQVQRVLAATGRTPRRSASLQLRRAAWPPQVRQERARVATRLLGRQLVDRGLEQRQLGRRSASSG